MSHLIKRVLAPACLAVAPATLVSACGGDQSHVQTTVSDSSGVRITVSPDRDDIYAEVDSVPSVDLGRADVDGPEQFYNVQGIHVDDARNIWVANRGSNELRMFHPDGSHWKTVGRPGDGPGEFRQIRLLGGYRDGRIALWDDGNPRLTLVTDDGELDSLVTVTSGATVPRADAVIDDDALLVRFPQVIAAGSIAPGTALADTFALFRYDVESNNATRLASVSGPVWIWTGRFQVPVPFTIKAAVAVDGTGALHIADGPIFRIRLIEDGTVKESYGVDREPRPVTDSDRAAYRSLIEANLTDSTTATAYLSGLRHGALPSRLPAYSQLLIDSDGRTWALIYSADPLAGGSWDVYDPDRHYLGTVTTPPGLIVSAIAGQSIAGIWRDEFGVEHVRLYAFSLE